MVCGKGLKLRALREERGLSLRNTGELLEVSGGTVFNWEHGKGTPRAGWGLVLNAVASMRITLRKIALSNLPMKERKARLLRRFIKGSRAALQSATELEDDHGIKVNVDCIRKALETTVKELLKLRASVSPTVAGASGR